MLSARLDKQAEDDQVHDKVEKYVTLSNEYYLTDSDNDIFDAGCQLEQQIQNQEKDSGWRFEKYFSKTIYF